MLQINLSPKIIFQISLFLCSKLISQDIEKYYDIKNGAELCYVRGELKESQMQYEKAFAHKHNKPFAADLYNYGYLNCQLKNYYKAKESFKILLSLGLSSNYFTQSQDTVIKLFLGSSEGATIRNFDETQLAGSIDRELRYEIRKRINLDRKFRLYENGYRDFMDSIIFVDHKNGDFLKALIAKYNGLPDESVVGLDSMDIVQPPYYALILHHSFGAFGRKFDFSQQIADAIITGRLHNSIGSDLFEKAQEKYELGTNAYHIMVYDSLETVNIFNPFKKENFPLADVCSGWYIPELSKIELININRKKLLLETLGELAIKRDAIKNRIPLLFSYVNIMNWKKRADFDGACSKLFKD